MSPNNHLATNNNHMATNHHFTASGDNRLATEGADFMSSMGAYDYLFKNNPPDEIDPSIVSMKTSQQKKFVVDFYSKMYFFNY